MLPSKLHRQLSVLGREEIKGRPEFTASEIAAGPIRWKRFMYTMFYLTTLKIFFNCEKTEKKNSKLKILIYVTFVINRIINVNKSNSLFKLTLKRDML